MYGFRLSLVGSRQDEISKCLVLKIQLSDISHRNNYLGELELIEMETEKSPPSVLLNLTHHINRPTIIINRSYFVFNSIALLALFHYRTYDNETPTLIWLLLFFSELVFTFLWITYQALEWRPISRSVYPERLPVDDQLPGLDVLICTADPNKEPTLDVMNTIISAMALDYPTNKLSVFLSDDGGSAVTLKLLKAAWGFAKCWLPFCRTYRLTNRCPQAYFSAPEDFLRGQDFIEDRQKIEMEYDMFKERVKLAKAGVAMENNSLDHPSIVEVIADSTMKDETDNLDMPLLVYVSREKRPSQPHHFKAGALNALLRVSGSISNSPYILVLDCDMYCNDPSSARKAMCFHLDSSVSASLALVQFPQKFHNIGVNDIYDSQLRHIFKTSWQGMDGLLGPIMSGTGFYLKRDAIYGISRLKDANTTQLKQRFGQSDLFVSSINKLSEPKSNILNVSPIFRKEITSLVSCSYENGTQWGSQVGFMYHSVVEDYATGFHLHCEGYTTIFCDPPTPQFLGSATTNLHDVIVQGIRWYTGLFNCFLSKFCPLTYGCARMSVLQSMCYAAITLFPLYCLPILILATIPQLCLINDILVYPKATDPYFLVYLWLFLSSLLKHLHQVISSEGSIQVIINEQRMWMIKSVTSCFYGTLGCFANKLGIRKASFVPTNKFVNKERDKLYQMGKYDFQTSTMFLLPLVSLVLLNAVSFAVGSTRLVFKKDYGRLSAQLILSLYILIMSYPVIEAVTVRRDKGSIPTRISLLSAFVCLFGAYVFALLVVV
ncbi:unnamed protein product [Rhodiola kirilowii]